MAGLTIITKPPLRPVGCWLLGCWSVRHESDGLRIFFFWALFLKVCKTVRQGGLMPDPLSAYVDDRSTLLQQISELGDFQPGSVTSASRRCGSPSCHCAKPNDPGHGPHFQLTQK